MEEERASEDEGRTIQDGTPANEVQISERATERSTNDDSSIVHPLSYRPESRHSLEIATSVSGRGAEQIQIPTIDNDNASDFNKNLLARKSL